MSRVKYLQPLRQYGKHVHSEVRVFRNQFHKSRPWKKNRLAFLQRFGISGKGSAEEQGYLAERLAGANNMENLLFSLQGKLEHFYPPGEQHVETIREITLRKYKLTPFEGAGFRDSRQFPDLRLRQSLEESNIRNKSSYLFHKSRHPRK